MYRRLILVNESEDHRSDNRNNIYMGRNCDVISYIDIFTGCSIEINSLRPHGLEFIELQIF